MNMATARWISGGEDGADRHLHYEWFQGVAQEIQNDYVRLRDIARQQDPQRAGHGAEATWSGVLKDWLPRNYEVVTRKYIIPEQGTDSFEMDLVVISPGYPERLRSRSEVMTGGVAAAFSARLTLDKSGIDDAVDRAVRLRRGSKPWPGSPRAQMLAPYPVGLLAHSHDWKSPGSNPLDNVTSTLMAADQNKVTHPREFLDFVCVADLGTWGTLRAPVMPVDLLAKVVPQETGVRLERCAMTAVGVHDPGKSPAPVGVLIGRLISMLAYNDPALHSMAEGFRQTGTLGEFIGHQRPWDLPDIFSEDVIRQIVGTPARVDTGDWSKAFF